MEYSLNINGPYSEEIPVGKEQKAYTVWYRVAGDANYNDVAPKSLKVSIYDPETPKTGDSFQPVVWGSVLAASVAGLGALMFFLTKKKK